jgi:phytoene synthase
MSAQLASGLSPPQRLALAYCPARARAPTLALLALDERLASVVRARREPLASQMRLAWWRDLVVRSQDQWPSGEPVVAALRSWRDASGLAPLVDGWEALLTERLTPDVIAAFVDGRGQAFSSLAIELGVERPDDAAQAARVWALADLAANISDGAERDVVIDYGRALTAPPRLSASLRPLAVLSALGAAALDDGGSALLSGPRSALTALRIGLTGR